VDTEGRTGYRQEQITNNRSYGLDQSWGRTKPERGNQMKKAKTTIAAITMLSGILLAGSEASTMASQVICCAAGIMAAAGGAYWLTVIGRG